MKMDFDYLNYLTSTKLNKVNDKNVKSVRNLILKIGTTITSPINFMTRGFDDLILTFYKTKLCDHDKDNW